MGSGNSRPMAWALGWAAWALVAVSAPAAAQDRVEALGEPTARASEGFTSIFDVAELPDGRVLLTDNRERSLAVLDLDGGSVERLGRTGQGPREYQGVFSITEHDGGYRVYDAGNQRFLLVSADGAITGTEGFERPPFSGLAPPRGPDPDGGVYFTLRQVGSNGLERPAVLYRWDPSTGDADSVATAMQFAPGQEGSGIVPMPQADAWSVAGDGSVVVVRSADYRVEWSGGAAGAAVGGPLDYPRVPVDSDARDRWIEGMLSRSGGSSSMSGGAAGGAAADTDLRRRVREYRDRLDVDRFPEYLPPFEGGYVPAAPGGEVWIRVQPASDESRTVFDVIGRNGERVRTVAVEGRARVVGFGEGSVYVVRTDEFDLEWLERYSRPS